MLLDPKKLIEHVKSEAKEEMCRDFAKMLIAYADSLKAEQQAMGADGKPEVPPDH